MAIWHLQNSLIARCAQGTFIRSTFWKWVSLIFQEANKTARHKCQLRIFKIAHYIYVMKDTDISYVFLQKTPITKLWIALVVCSKWYTFHFLVSSYPNVYVSITNAPGPNASCVILLPGGIVPQVKVVYISLFLSYYLSQSFVRTSSSKIWSHDQNNS